MISLIKKIRYLQKHTGLNNYSESQYGYTNVYGNTFGVFAYRILILWGKIKMGGGYILYDSFEKSM